MLSDPPRYCYRIFLAREGAVLHDHTRPRVGCEICFVGYGLVLHLRTASHKEAYFFLLVCNLNIVLYCSPCPVDLHTRPISVAYLRFLFYFAVIKWTGDVGVFGFTVLVTFLIGFSVSALNPVFRFSVSGSFRFIFISAFGFWVFDDKEIGFSVLFHYLLGWFLLLNCNQIWSRCVVHESENIF